MALTFVHGAASAAGEASAPGVFYLSSGRLGAIAAMSIGVAGLVGGVRALRSARRAGIRDGNRRRWFSVALVAGTIAVALGAFVILTAPGGVGTGNGLAGAVLGVVLGLMAIGLAGFSRLRQRI